MLLAALCISVQADSPSLLYQDFIHLGSEEHPNLQAIDRLCSATNTEGDTCYITDKSLRLTSDFKYKTDLNLVFDNTIIRCITSQYHPCSFWFEMGSTSKEGGITLKNGSLIQGKQVIIYAP